MRKYFWFQRTIYFRRSILCLLLKFYLYQLSENGEFAFLSGFASFTAVPRTERSGVHAIGCDCRKISVFARSKCSSPSRMPGCVCVCERGCVLLSSPAITKKQLKIVSSQVECIYRSIALYTEIKVFLKS